MEVILARRALIAGRLAERVWVAVDGPTIIDVGVGEPPTPCGVVLEEGVLAPGLVDAQLNGAFGTDFADGDASAWDEILQRLPSTGVTSVVPTLITAPVPFLAERLGDVARRWPSLSRPPRGRARVLGMHLEGPFLAPRRRGAHAAEHMVDPTPERLNALLAAADGALLYVTLAPEREGALDAIHRLVSAGVRVAVGHSDATDEQVAAAVAAGATIVTHLFNAQRPLAHRDPGVVGAALADARLTVGLIVDLHHVAPTAVRVAFAAAAGRVMLVTDAMAALGMPPGTYVLGGQQTVVREGGPPVRPDGTIAGSAVRLDEAIGNAVLHCGIDPSAALVAATRTPADALGRPDLGRLRSGAPADLVWLGPDWRTRATWIAGQLIHGPVELKRATTPS